MTANDQLQESAIAHAVDLRAYSDSAVRQMLTILNRSEASLVLQLRAVLDRMSPDSFTVQRLESQLGTVRQTIAASYERLSGQMSLEMEDFARYETAWQATTMEAALPAVINVATVAPAQVYAAAMARPFQGALLSQWITTLDTDTATRVRRSIVQGFSESKTTDQIIRDIRGTKARGYKDGVLEISRREAEAVVRTALSHTAAVAGEQFETRNADIIKQVRWLSTLDTRTSPPCRLRDGLLYEAGTHKPVGHSYPWGAGPGQFHWRAVAAGSMIQTARGPLPVEQVLRGDQVLTHRGRYKPVTQVRSKQSEHGIIRAVHLESGRVLRATDDHPVPVVGRGWCFVGALKVGDQLFGDAQQLGEVGSVPGLVVAHAQDGPALADEPHIALQRTLRLAAARMNLDGAADVDPSEVEHVAADLVLRDPSWIEDESLAHHFLALGELLAQCGRERLRNLLALRLADWDASFGSSVALVDPAGAIAGHDLVGDAWPSRGVVQGHGDRAPGVMRTGLFRQTVGPVLFTYRRFVAVLSVVLERLFPLGAHRQVFDPGVAGEGAIGEPVFALKGSERLSVADMAVENQMAVIGEWARHDRVVALELQNYDDLVFDLEVQDDASYLCNGTVVSNCRSTRTFVTKGWQAYGIDSFTPAERASMDGQVPAELSYGDWLKRQSAARQNEVLGVERGKLFRSGDLTLDQMYSARGVPLTLEQLRKKL